MTLLALECGAEWPSWAAGLRTRALHSAVEMQAPDEALASFRERVERRLLRIREKGQTLLAAGYVCALAAEDEEQRRALCHELLHALVEDQRAELIVAGGAWEVTGPESDARSRLIELWSGLTMECPRKSVSVRFETPQSESGVFPAAAPAEPSCEGAPPTERLGAARVAGPSPSPGALQTSARRVPTGSTEAMSRPRSPSRSGASTVPPPVVASLTETLA